MPLKITDANYAEYKKVTAIMWKHLSALLPPQLSANGGPIEFLNALEQKSLSFAKRGLKAGLTDLLSWLKQMSGDSVQKIDADLKANGLPSIAKLYGEISNTVQKVLKKKKITSEHEFYVVKEYMMAPEDDTTGDDRTLLFEYLEKFELKKR